MKKIQKEGLSQEDLILRDKSPMRTYNGITWPL